MSFRKSEPMNEVRLLSVLLSRNGILLLLSTPTVSWMFWFLKFKLLKNNQTRFGGLEKIKRSSIRHFTRAVKIISFFHFKFSWPCPVFKLCWPIVQSAGFIMCGKCISTTDTVTQGHPTKCLYRNSLNESNNLWK